MSQPKNKVPLKEGLWEMDLDGKPYLVGSKCSFCGEVFFPKRDINFCIHCQKEGVLEEVKLGRKAKIESFTIVMQRPGGPFYKGDVPYAYGCVILEEGVRVETLFTTTDPKELKLGRDVELVLDKLYEDDESEIITFKFKPVWLRG